MAVDPNNALMLIFAVFAGTLAAIVYALRILLLLERRIARIDMHIENLVKSVMKEELKIEKEEKLIETQLNKTKKKK